MTSPSFPTSGFSLLALLLLPADLGAQCPPGASPPPPAVTASAPPADDSPAWTRWKLGREALASGDRAVAQRHLLAALELRPDSPPILLDLLLACGDDRDQQALWGERFVRAASNDRGRLKLDRDTRRRLPKTLSLAEAERLTTDRAKAIAEVGRWLKRLRPGRPHPADQAILAGFGSTLLRVLGRGAPSPLDAVAERAREIHDSFGPDLATVFAGLGAILRHTATEDEDAAAVQDRALRAARLVAGLARQAAFRDLQGPKPPAFDGLADQASDLLRRLREEVRGAARVWTVEELEAMTPAERTAFTDAHDHWRHPGVARSPNGRYRIETTCGHGTLLGAARTIERHHARLAAHFGKDPFSDRPGLIRIVPEHRDLETEGAPYWWAAGFQSGDRTTVRFAWGTIPGLGRLLTHELTHRFDAVLHPFLGGWYTEGHAVWTAAHYERIDDPSFLEDHLQTGAVDAAWRKGYGDRTRLEQLLRGEIEDYRDNYTAGYALYAYLRGYPPKAKPRFRRALERFVRTARGGRTDPVEHFTRTFCDGEEGRPASFDEFVKGWREFVRGVGMHSIDPARKEFRWVERYGRRRAERGKEVADRPTWSWERNRAEPFFGQDHATAATRLLREVGATEAVIAAGIWALSVDGWRRDLVEAVREALGRSGRRGPTAAFDAIARLRFPDLPSERAAVLAAQLPRTTAFAEALAARAASLAASGATLAAAAAAADYDELAALLDLPPRDPPLPADLADGTPPPVPVWLGVHGFGESRLASYDRRRKPGLWYVTPGGDLHVGRARPRSATGTVDRRAHQRDAFVRAETWQLPGAYTLRGRVHFTTSYARGAIVFGLMRRDRHLRLEFASGDFDYATGRRSDNRRFGKARFRMRGLWERDGHLPGSRDAFSAEVGDDAWFDYEVAIRGPRVLVRINGGDPYVYTMHDGQAIEGRVGFATSMGAIRIQHPTVQRLDRHRPDAWVGLDLARPARREIDELLGLPVAGLPRDPRGTLVLWIPRSEEDTELLTRSALPRALPVMAKVLNSPHLYPQPWLVAFPRELDAPTRGEILDQVAAIRGSRPPAVEHRVGAPLTGSWPWVLFVDGFGVLRAAADVADPRFHTRVQAWSRRFRPR